MKSSENPVLAVKDLSLKYCSRSGMLKRFEHTVLQGINFELFRGETLGIIGRNGCGKSSLLRILSGIINPSAGHIYLAHGVRRALLALGLGVQPELSGRDNALLSAMMQGANKKQALNLLDGIQEFSELGEFFDQPVKVYSAGMRSRLGFSTALKTQVDILLIDEILSVGDQHFRHKAEAALKNKINGDQTVILVSHNGGQIKELCNRAIWLENGSIRVEADAEETLKKYNQHVSKMDKQNAP